MTKESAFKKYLEAKDHPAYWAERVKNQFAVSVERILDLRKLKKKDLAERMDVSPPYITKILRGDANVTLETIGRLAHALEAEVRINLSPKESKAIPFRYSVDGFKRSETRVGETSTENDNTRPVNELWAANLRKFGNIANG